MVLVEQRCAMRKSCFDRDRERIIIEADSLVDLDAGQLDGLFLCRARTLTAIFVRYDAHHVDFVIVRATCPDEAIDKIQEAIDAGMMVRRDTSSTMGRRATDSD
jgi:hypothetical protein